MGGPVVAAVIVTHNRPAAVLARCADLRGQTRRPDLVIVVDNGGSAEILASLRETYPEVLVDQLPTNLGPAGGFAAGFSRALERGGDLIWAMDDDLEPAPDCLEALLAEAQPAAPAVILPSRFSERGPGRLNRGWYGCLVPAAVVRRVGLPRADFFWWAEDVEFFIRVRDAGIAVRTSPRARVWHRLARAPRDYPAWKFYYEARNSLYYRLHIRRNRSKFAKSLLKVALRGAVLLVKSGDRPRMARMMIRGVQDGIAGRLGKTVDPLGA